MITIGSLILLICIGKICNQKNLYSIYRSLFALTIIVELLIERGFFIQIGSIQIAYRTICEILLCVISIILIVRSGGGVKRKISILTMLFVLVVVVGLIMLCIFPTGAVGATMEVSWDEILVSKIPKQKIVFGSGMYTEIIQLFLYVVIIVTAVSKLSKNDFMIILEKVIKCSKYLLCLNCIEIFTKYIFHSNVYIDILNKLLGVSYSTVNTLDQRGRGFVLSGGTKEASHFAFSLFILFILVFAYYTKNKQKSYDYMFFSIIFLNFILTMSFSTVYYGLCALLTIWAYCFEKKGYSQIKFISFFILFILGISFAIYYLPLISTLIGNNGFWGRRISSVLEEISLLNNEMWLKASTALEWSNRVRLGSTYETFKLIKYRPLFGLGFSAVSAHSSLAMLFSGVGIIGTILCVEVIFSWCKRIINLNMELYYTFIFIFLFSLILNSLSLRPFYEMWNILLGYSFALLSSRGEKNNV